MHIVADRTLKNPEQFKQQLSLQCVLQNLDKNEHYSVLFTVERAGKTRWKRGTFSYLDREKRVVVYNRVDVTEIVEEYDSFEGQ